MALDEELIGIRDSHRRSELLDQVRPAYIILKPGLLGGFSVVADWIALAGKYGVGWWLTSALESNVGLNAIAQWTWKQNTSRPQGLGTGALYTNNIPSPLQLGGQHLWYRPHEKWDLNYIGQ